MNPTRMRNIGGILPVLATPFDEHGEVDLESFEAQVEMAIDDGVDALAMFGMASEYYKLTDDERRLLIQRLLRASRRRVPIIVSVTHHATEIAIRQAREAQDSGADAIMILPPFFLDPPLPAILEHIACVARAVDIPSILQYAPAQTKIGPEVLAGLPVSIVKIDAVPFAPAAASVPPHRQLLAGYMGLDLPDAVISGCRGVMPTASLSPQFRKVWDLLKKAPEQGRAAHARLLPLLQFMMQSIEFLVQCEKHLLVRREVFRTTHSRRPLASLSSLQLDRLNLIYDTLCI